MRDQMNLLHLDAQAATPGLFHAIVETPRGSRNKFKFDDQFNVFKLDKVLPLGACFPFDFGFIPSTQGEDGDPLDVLVLMDEPAFPGCMVPVRFIGVLEAEQTEHGETVRNDRLLAVADTKYRPPVIQSLKELPNNRLDEIVHFFVSYNRMEGRTFKPLSRHGPSRATRLIEEGMERFQRERTEEMGTAEP